MNTKIWLFIVLLFLCWQGYYQFDRGWIQGFFSFLINSPLRIISIFGMTILMSTLIILPYKWAQILRRLPIRVNLAIIIALFIAPLTPAFANKFWAITASNSAEFFALLIPVLLMVIIVGITPEPTHLLMEKEERDEKRTELSNFLSAPQLKKSRRNKGNPLYIGMMMFWFLFGALLIRMHALGKVEDKYGNILIWPILLFIIWSVGISKWNSSNQKTENKPEKAKKNSKLWAITLSTK